MRHTSARKEVRVRADFATVLRGRIDEPVDKGGEFAARRE